MKVDSVFLFFGLVVVFVFVMGLIKINGVVKDDQSDTRNIPPYSEQAKIARANSEKAPSKDPAGSLEVVSRQQFGDRLKSFKLYKLQSGSVVNVRFIASDNFTFGMVRIGIEQEVIDFFHSMFRVGSPVVRAVATADYVHLDALGHERESRVYEASMKRELTRKINWDNRHHVDMSQLGVVDFVDSTLEGL